MNTAHLDHETLAELAEGLLDDARATSANAHLERCRECAGRAAEIENVSRLLAEAPVPPMPADLVSRIDAAIAAEARASRDAAGIGHAHGQDQAAAHVTGHGRPHGYAAYRMAKRRARRFQILSAAAAAVVVVGGGVLVGRTALDDRNMSGGAGKPVAEPSKSASSTAENVSPRLGAGADGASEPSGRYPVVRSGLKYTTETLVRQVSDTLMHPGWRADVRTQTVSPRLTGCLARVTNGVRRPLVVDLASYNGRPATIVVFAWTSPDQSDVWVYGPRCSSTTSDLITRATASRHG